MKGIILAGGTGTRLFPITISVSKQLLPVYDKPMIYYPLSVLMLAGIKEILLITTPHDQKAFKKLLGDGSQVGCKFSYEVQEEPKGLAEAFTIGEEFIGNDKVALVLGDNIFYGSGLVNLLRSKVNINGASIFAFPVKDPERYGVVEFDEDNKVKSIEEKPKKPKSKYAIPGLYFYDNKVVEFAKNVKPSARGEKEISTINQMYLDAYELEVGVMTRGSSWFDTGTVESLDDATEFIRVLQNRQSTMIGCIEEVAYRSGFIDKPTLHKLSKRYGKSKYGTYLREIASTIPVKEIDNFSR
ncbi:glucose-1-phosphate thymidylyltransferase RfbA [Antarcticibacterium sp. 1MA-6-2]|uniref:glucose-1-phosphate thymidylyltransferase RfbA n=1 Tax=Antarcticibacterium sp. 1MA-6-2 TaxID=2908210 RepID=UPI001F306F11|nr:glucose-1-phosphate thymidylyltransferase RfbA [Antarcticibacterium sp. 1MA-6-2]UJH91290.1 glucose-1-phosphate thymidylyltransferase RfbA [Antarcticibacterium sp. 1MA-6-2]